MNREYTTTDTPETLAKQGINPLPWHYHFTTVRAPNTSGKRMTCVNTQNCSHSRD